MIGQIQIRKRSLKGMCPTFLVYTSPGSVANNAKTYFVLVSTLNLETDGSSLPHKKKKKSFKYNYDCKLCSNSVSSNEQNSYIFPSHLKRMHKDVYDKIIENSSTAAKNGNALEIKRVRFLQQCTEIVTINGRPFSSLYDSGFIKLTASLRDELEKAGKPVQLTDKNLPHVKDYILKLHARLKDEIKIAVQSKLLSVMVDIATKNNRAVMGITVQFRSMGELKIICTRAD